jgi:murein DD-endopeptidase MepM/ murein hydrolase activator NlpD
MASHESHRSSAEFQQSVQANRLTRHNKDRRIIFAHGDSVQVLRIAPWIGALCVLFILVGAVGVIGSASYLFFRDELFTASIKRQHQIQVAYEDRISDLRRQIDRITSRQLLNQQAYETRVERLLTEHTQLYQQGTRMDALLDQAGHLGLVPRQSPPSPVVPPNQRAMVMGTESTAMATSAFAPIPDGELITGSIPQLPTHRGIVAIERAVIDPAGILNSIEEVVDVRSHNQVVALAGLAATADSQAETIITELTGLGIRLSLPSESQSAASSSIALDGVGGPLLEPVAGADQFSLYIEDAARALDDLDAARAAISTVPVAAPARQGRLTSRFGNRRDPFTRRTAFHSGIDYAAPRGTPVYAPADGVVVSSGRAGGYGIRVEIDHPNGLSTRFAHLSRALVSRGTQVRAGDQIGLIGSTGRSTGPHLHYEVRRGSRAIDPMPFVRAGQRIAEMQ